MSLKFFDGDKLSIIGKSAPPVSVDSALSSTSTNPVENKAIYNEILKQVGEIDSALSLTSENAVQNKIIAAAIEELGEGVKSVSTDSIGPQTGIVSLQGTDFLNTVTIINSSAPSWTNTATRGTNAEGANCRWSISGSVKLQKGSTRALKIHIQGGRTPLTTYILNTIVFPSSFSTTPVVLCTGQTYNEGSRKAIVPASPINVSTSNFTIKNATVGPMENMTFLNWIAFSCAYIV